MTPYELINKWRDSELRERQGAQEWFLDVCRLAGHPTPAESDKTGETFCFERGAEKVSGGGGWADVWKRRYFGWEFKGRHKDLDRAYRQLAEYRDALENPPLLVVSDFDRILIHTSFTGTPTEVHEIPVESLADPARLEKLRAVFFDPGKLRPGRFDPRVTEVVATDLAKVAHELRSRGLDPQAVARFLDRVVFCLFAEDVGLLPEKLMSRLLNRCRHEAASFPVLSARLFGAMRVGDFFGTDRIRQFDGYLFDDDATLELTQTELERLYQASRQDWSAIDPSIFGTLFERGTDPAKRSQLGLHYTGYRDIETLVEPVVMDPLRREWAAIREPVENLMRFGTKTRPENGGKAPTGRRRKKAQDEAEMMLDSFLRRLASVKVLDPACGSGNFLYVTLQKLLDLEYEVYTFAQEVGIPARHQFLSVGPWQMYGIEYSRYACELAQTTVWIGYLQWLRHHGLPWGEDPILREASTIRRRDAILDLTGPGEPREPEWPKVDFIVGNPPFLGGKFLRRELGDEYVDRLFELWDGRVRREADLCCYWFEKARAAIEGGRCRRAGLLATQAIRGGANREVLRRIKESGDVFFAVSDREWVLEGANVHVSLVAFDDGSEEHRALDGRAVGEIHSNLTAVVDLAGAARLSVNAGVSFMGITPAGPFDLPFDDVREWLAAPNPHGRPNSDVLRPWFNGADLTGRARGCWTIDMFGLSETEASRYECPFEYLMQTVALVRRDNPAQTNESWWEFERPRGKMRRELGGLGRYLATSMVAKHRFYTWLETASLPANVVIAFARDDDYFFGVLHSRPHEVWSLRQGTRLETRPRYTPTTCFETFPFPWPLGEEPGDDPRVQAVAEAARELDELRRRWLDPPEWLREEVLEFPGSAGGPWSAYLHDLDDRGLGTVRWPRLVPKAAESAAKLATRTLTNLYNQRPAWLDDAHRKLDAAVFEAYGWGDTPSDDGILERLLALNLEAASGGGESG